MSLASSLSAFPSSRPRPHPLNPRTSLFVLRPVAKAPQPPEASSLAIACSFDVCM